MKDIKKYEFIDALRGLAVLGVILVHVRSWVAPPDYLVDKVEYGALGVQLFYVASAFTLFLSMSSRKNTERHPIKNFFIRRFFRIAPLFYLAVVFWLIKDGFTPRYWAPDGISFWHILSTLTFTHGWHPHYPNAIVPVGWSIAVEMSFYVVVPFLFRFIGSLQRALQATIFFLILGKGLSYIGNLVIASHFPESQKHLVSFFFGAFWLPAEMAVFGCGIVLYYLFRDYRNQFLNQNILIRRGLVIGSTITMLALTFVPVPSRLYPFSALFALFAFGLSIEPMKLFVNRFTCYMGKISYSMYLVHFAVLSSLPWFLPQATGVGHLINYIAAYLVVLVLSTLISSITYRVIEVPGQLLGKRLIQFLERPRIKPELPT
jgi:peptidoglycan/LPS O-acetylase OafA/YrhL